MNCEAASLDPPNRRRILVLTVDPACPPVSGADLRNYQNAKAAAQFGDVCLLSVKPIETAGTTDDGIRIDALSRLGEPAGRSARRRRTSIEPRISCKALDRLDEAVRDFAPDTVIVEGIPLYGLIERLRPSARLLILDMHNVESLLSGPIATHQNLARRLLPSGWTDEGRIREMERKALAIVDRVWVCSELDRARVTDNFGAGVAADIVPNGIPRFDQIPVSLPPLPGKSGGWPNMLFVGHLGYWPNVAAVKRLVCNILPIVQRTYPTARAIVAGRKPDPRVGVLASLPGVEIAADPHDLSQFFRRSHVSVIPLSAGGGTRIKILEANAQGVAVVATALAAEGNAVEDEKDIMIAETDDALAKCVLALCADPERLERQRRLAYERAFARFGPPVIEAAVAKGLGVHEDAG